jgi:hypothetical protein
MSDAPSINCVQSLLIFIPINKMIGDENISAGINILHVLLIFLRRKVPGQTGARTRDREPYMTFEK